MAAARGYTAAHGAAVGPAEQAAQQHLLEISSERKALQRQRLQLEAADRKDELKVRRATLTLYITID